MLFQFGQREQTVAVVFHKKFQRVGYIIPCPQGRGGLEQNHQIILPVTGSTEGDGMQDGVDGTGGIGT